MWYFIKMTFSKKCVKNNIIISNSEMYKLKYIFQYDQLGNFEMMKNGLNWKLN